MPFEGEKFEEIPTPPEEEKEEVKKESEEGMEEKIKEELKEIGLEKKEEVKEFEESLEKLIGAERLEKVKERAGENLGVIINSELLTCEYYGREWVGKTVEEAKALVKEKLPEASAEEREFLESHLRKSDEELKELLEENEKNFIEFEKAREESLNWFIESDIKNIRINPWKPESWLNWENVEKGKSGRFEVNPRAEEIFDRLIKAGKDIDLVIHFGNKNYFGKENRYNIPSSEEEIKAYTNFCGFIAEHFKGKISRFEISSQPNVKPEGLVEGIKAGFPPNSNPELYGKVAAKAAEVIKNKNPEAEIIFGNVALFDPGFIEKGLKEVKKYEEKLRREGKIGPDQYLIDYVGFHPYRENPEGPCATVEKGEGQFEEWQDKAAREKYGYKSYEDQIEIYEKIIKKYSPKVKLMNTEFGWQVGKEWHSKVTNEEKKAEYLLKSVAIDASHGVSSTAFELFEFNPKKRVSGFSLIDIWKEHKPTKGFKNLEKFNGYLEFFKEKGEKKKKESEKWIETKKEFLKEQTRSTFSNLYKKIFPERIFNIHFLDAQAFLRYCQERKLPLPSWKKPEEVFFNRYREKNAMNYLINEGKFYEIFKKHVEFSKKRKELKTKEEIVERTIIKLAAHEVRHDLHEEKLIELITPETLKGYKELQKEYKKIFKDMQKEKTPSSYIPEECGVIIIERTVEELWNRGIKDMDLISKIVRYGDGQKIGEISNLLKDEKLETTQLLEKIKELF